MIWCDKKISIKCSIYVCVNLLQNNFYIIQIIFQEIHLGGCIGLGFWDNILTKTILKILKDYVGLYWFCGILKDFF